MAAKSLPRQTLAVPQAAAAAASGQRMSLTVPTGAFDRRPSGTPRRNSVIAPLEELKPEVDPVKAPEESAVMDAEEAEKAKAHDMTLVQLLIALSNFSKEDVREVAARKCVIGAGTFNATPAFRLMRAIKMVIAERRRQFVHYRLQELVYNFKTPSGLAFHLPEGMSSPRTELNLDVRDAWWRHATSHSDIVRKEDMFRKSRAAAPGASSGSSLQKPAGGSAGGGKRATLQGRSSDYQAAGRWDMPMDHDSGDAAPSAPSRREVRDKRNTLFQKQTTLVIRTGAVAEAARNAANAARHASPQRGTRATKKGTIAIYSDGAEVRPRSHLDEISLTEPTESSSTKKTQFSNLITEKTTSGGYKVNSKRRVTHITQEGLKATHVYLVQDQADADETGEASPSPPSELEEDPEEDDEAYAKQRRRTDLANIIMDASGGVIGQASDCPVGATELIRTSPMSTPSEAQSPRELPDMPYKRGTIVGLNVVDALQSRPRPGSGELRPSSASRSGLPSKGKRRPSSAGAIRSAGAIGHKAVSVYWPDSDKKTGGRRPSSASGLERSGSNSPQAQSRGLEGLPGRSATGDLPAEQADKPAMRRAQTFQPRPVSAAADQKSKLRRQATMSASTRAPSSATSSRRLNSASSLGRLNSASSIGSRSSMRSTETNLRKFNEYADGNLRFETARNITGLRQQEPWAMSKPAMTSAAQKEWGWTPQKSLQSPVTRPSSAPDSKEDKRTTASRNSLLGKIIPHDDGTEKLLPPGTWGAEIEKCYVPVPSSSSKSVATPVRQQKLNQKVDGLLQKVGYNLKYVRQGMLLRSQVRVDLDPDYRDMFGRYIGEKDKRDEVTIATERPPKVTKVIREFGERHKTVHLATGCKAATHTYLQEIQTRLRAPAIPKCLQISDVPAEDVDAPDEELEDRGEGNQINIKHANICDDEAIPMLMGLRQHTASFNYFDLGGNPRLTDSTYLSLFRQFAELASASGIRYLDLSGGKGMGEGALLLLSKCMHGPLGKLEFLRMDSIAVAEHVWPALEEGMQSLIYLQELSLADMHIGRQSQRSAISVADILLGLPNLQSLNVSSNYFGLPGCKTLAENMGRNRTLVRLDLSNNAGGFVSMANTGKRTGNAKGYEERFPDMLDPAKNPCISKRSLPFNPLSLICEGLANARALKVLNLSSCQLTYDEDFVLEDAILEKAGAPIEELDLAGNPCQGPMGARCLLRLTMHSVSLHRLDVRELREALPAAASIPYEPADPSVFYQADLSHPQHRALIRTLLRRCRNSNEDPRKAFEWEDPKFGEAIITALRNGGVMPDVGSINFGCKMGDPIPNSNVDILGLIDKLGLKRKLKVSLWGFTRVAELFKNLMDEASRRVLLGAMSTDLLLKLCHVRVLSEMDCKLRVEVAEYLLPAVHSLDRMGGFDTIFAARGPSAEPLQVKYKSTLNLLMFNACTPNGHYEMDLSVPADRRILEQLLIINEWERARCFATDHGDLSQHGRHECLRNVKINGSNIKFDSMTASIPPRGEMFFDYCTPFRVPSDTEPSSDEVVELIEQALINSACSDWLKVSALRTVLHRLALKPQQFADMVKIVPAAQHLPTNEDGEQQLSPRVEAFITVFPFCVDPAAVVSSKPWGLYGGRLLARDEMLMVRTRLGRLRTWDFLRCDEAMLCAGPRLPQNFFARREEAEKDENSMKRLLANLQLRDDPTSRGNANKYVLNLENCFEDLMCIRILLDLASKESGEHFDMPSWSEKAHLEERGTKWLIPPEWNTEVPQQGILSVRYFSERDGCKDEEVRKVLAAKYLGW